MGLELYAKIEPYLDFEEEIYTLHKEFLKFIMTNDLDNILDIGCGQGYFLENLKINKKNYLGIDLSFEQIRVCKEKNLNAQCIELSKIDKKFDCATAIFDVLNYLDKKELKEFLEQTYNILNDNGYFIFDVNTLFGFDEVAQGTIVIDNDDNFISIDAIFEDNKLFTNMTMFSKEENNLFSKEKDEIIQHYHSKNELETLVKTLGFKLIEVRNFNLHSNEKSDKLLFVIKR